MSTQIRTIRLSENAYEPRRTIGGGTVKDAMPWDGAIDYVTDGEQYGVRYDDGRINWLGADLAQAFGDDVEVIPC
jgi:hypothetical protein